MGASTFAAAPGYAQSDVDVAEARRLFEEGVTALDDQRFGEAATLLERSLALRETATVLYNLGLAYRGVGSYLRALGALERFLALAGDDPRFADTRPVVRAVAEELRAGLSHVRLTVRGGATEVRVDGAVVGSGDGSLELELDPGRHHLEVTRPGYRAARRDVDAGRGETSEVLLDASLDPLPGRLSVETSVADADIEVDGVVVGHGSYDAELAPGTYTVEVSAPDRFTQRRVVEIAAGTAERITVTLPTRVASEGEAPSSSGGGIDVATEWWFWTGIATFVVGSGVVIGVVASLPTTTPFENGNLGFTVEALARY